MSERTHTSRIAEYIVEHGPSSSDEVCAAIGIRPKTFSNLICWMVKRGEVERVDTVKKVIAGKRSNLAVYDLCETPLPEDASQVVQSALASRTPIELVWK